MLKSGGTAKATGLCNTFLPEAEIGSVWVDGRDVPISAARTRYKTSEAICPRDVVKSITDLPIGA